MTEEVRITRILPWKNSIQYPSRRLAGSTMRFPVQSTDATFSAFSTTNTTDFQSVGFVTVTVRSTFAILYVVVNVHVKHSVANATFDARLTLYRTSDGSDAGVSMARIADVLLPATADRWVPLNFTGFIILDINNMVPGDHRLSFRVLNNTVGTLTLVNANGFDELSYFIMGR